MPSELSNGLAIDLLNRLLCHILCLLSGQFSCVILINTLDSEAARETVQILIRWLHWKPTDLDIHSFLKRMYSDSTGQGLNVYVQLIQ